MGDKFKKFAGKEIVIEFSPARCIHAAKCVEALPRVFNPDARPWIQPDAAPASAAADAIRNCPSGALRYTLKQGEPEQPLASPVGQIKANGPIFVRGAMTLNKKPEARLALCRCGASHNKPLCDNSHREVRFKDDGCVSNAPVAAQVAAGALQLTALADGPLQVDGPLTLKNAKGDVIYQGEKCFLCRCGNSKGKPMCDGSHATAGFKS